MTARSWNFLVSTWGGAAPTSSYGISAVFMTLNMIPVTYLRCDETPSCCPCAVLCDFACFGGALYSHVPWACVRVADDDDAVCGGIFERCAHFTGHVWRVSPYRSYTTADSSMHLDLAGFLKSSVGARG